MKNTTNANDILDRMRHGTSTRSDTELAKALGVSQQSISSARSKGKVPDSWVRVIAEVHNLSANWILFGLGSMFLDSAHEPLRPYGTNADIPPPAPLPGSGQANIPYADGEMVLIPMVEARISAGGGSFETSGRVERHYAFRKDFLERKGRPSKMVLMRVDGDSMFPEIQHGDAVLIDESQTAPSPGGTYAVSVESMIYLKVVDAEPGRIILTSHNPAYGPITVDTRGQLEDTVRIIGRVIWLGREFF